MVRPEFASVAVFPAYAGMFHGTHPQRWTIACFPRMHGDVPAAGGIGGIGGVFPAYAGMSRVPHQCVSPVWGFPAYAGMFLSLRPCGITARGFPRIRGDIPEARPAMRKILLKKFSQQRSLFSFQTFRSGDHIKSAPTFTKPKVNFLRPNYKIPALC